jgi:hypothetical protein
MTESGVTAQIFVRLLHEGIEVWRPIQAERYQDGSFRIVDQPDDPRDEQWEFEPGEHVACEMIDAIDGPFLGAVRRLTQTPKTHGV